MKLRNIEVKGLTLDCWYCPELEWPIFDILTDTYKSE